MKSADAPRKATEASVRILVASDISSDTFLVKKLLSAQYDEIAMSACRGRHRQAARAARRLAGSTGNERA